jgi:hypothetical protein
MTVSMYISCTCFSNDVRFFIRCYIILQQPLQLVKKIVPLSINIHIHVHERTPHYIQEVEDYFFDCIHCYTFSHTETFLQMVSVSTFRWKECLYSDTWSISIQFTSSGPAFITSFLTLSSQLCPGISNSILPQELRTKNFCSFLPLTSTK